ncbi:Rv2231c family pyridoxal phosphate-dependent protein CobC [Amycolatopsis sp. CA-230715]|uniref:Rv2231c family pyridoxal phosphate-dependent protein CobC n=1 Tax=Amycolatopsis sp. CA-230715 TaxID=2745196 RepID=UPI001C01F19D|nr:Rv2231c family pyridoxal phosphate-dependent protein CobC [Amycolatopsis sp. CA-230715]QWF78345.1 putative aminotransferase [Amycolatopsis sp. CA-230715]
MVDLHHHGDQEIGDGLVDLAVNVRLSAPPPWLRRALERGLDQIAAYPDARPAVDAIAARHGVPPEEVLVTAGAAEAFTLLATALRPADTVIVHPQFTEPEAAMRAAGHPVRRVVLPAADGFVLKPDAVGEEADLVFVGNPTNPTSVLHPAETIRALCRPGRLVVVDEAFMDAVPGEPESVAGERLPGVAVIRSLTKTWGIAGLRCGYLLGPSTLVSRLRAVQPPWSVSTLAVIAAVACSAPSALDEAAVMAAQAVRDRDHLMAGLSSLGVTVPSVPQAPFVLAEVPSFVREALRSKGYAVRRGDSFPGLGTEHIRIAVRDRATTDGFLTALASVLLRRWLSGR